MMLLLILLGILSLVGVIATVVTTARDGYGRRPRAIPAERMPRDFR
ncbi:hypothetical protein [Herbiconiux solani]|nr:hypothetical protein [Herbiconiux solani]